MQGRISVIIPVYNVEQYLKKSLDSVISQSYRNLEIICVNDGSTDRSGTIIDEYANKDSRIKVIHKENKGVASARNCALDISTGEYIAFLDPDDWIELNAYEKMVSTIEHYNADIVVCNYSKDWDNKSKIMVNDVETEAVLNGYNEMILHIFHRTIYPGIAGYIWNRLYQRKMIGDIRFDESISVAEDVKFNVKVSGKMEKAVILNDVLYHYYQRDCSLFHSFDLFKREKILDIYESMINELFSQGLPDSTIQYLKRFYVYHAGGLVKMAYMANDKERLKNYQEAILKYLSVYEATSEGHNEWNERMHELLTNPGNIVEREG